MTETIKTLYSRIICPLDKKKCIVIQSESIFMCRHDGGQPLRVPPCLELLVKTRG
jgi:hypothetical protein